MKAAKAQHLFLFFWLLSFGILSRADYKLRPYQEIKLDNGLTVLLIEDQSLPLINLGLMIKAGSLHDPKGKAGLNNFVASMLEQGTKTRSATRFADELGQIAAELDISPGVDFTIISSSVISTQREKLLELFSDAIMNPAFSEEEIARQRRQILASLVKLQDNPSDYVDLLSDKEIFGTHPYAYPINGEIKSVKSLSKADLLRHYSEYYQPGNSILYLAGAFDKTFTARVKSEFSRWKATATPKRVNDLSSGDGKPELVLYSKPGLQQSQIRFIQRGIKRNNPDYLTLRLANVILGSDFASRLNMRVRVELGLTYSIHSELDANLDDGSFEISTFTRNEKVAETIKETKAVLKKFVETGATQKELDAAKALLSGQFPAAIETTEKLAFNLLSLRAYGISDDYLHNFNQNLQAITLDRVNEVIKKHIHPEAIKTIVYADKDQVLARLKTLGEVRLEEVKK